jgi:hypothetical protein
MDKQHFPRNLDRAFRTELTHRLAVHPSLAHDAIATLQKLLPPQTRECLSTARLRVGTHDDHTTKLIIIYSGWALICHTACRPDLHIRIWRCATAQRWLEESIGGSANAHG